MGIDDCCPPAIIADDLREGRLLLLSETSIRDSYGYYVVSATEPDAQRGPAIEAFLGWLLSTAPQP